MPVPLCQKQKPRPHAWERGEAENLRHPDHTPAALFEKSDFRKCCQQATMRVRPAHETPRWNKSPRGHRSRPVHHGRARGNRARRRRRAKTYSFVGERGTHRVLAKSEDNWMWNPPRLQSRPADQRMTKLTPSTARKNAPKSSTVVIPSLEIRSLEPHPKRETPSWRNTDQLSKEDFVPIEWEEKPTRPVGWSYREAIKDRWME